jgi:oligopeptide transport system ATP-binding protein
LLEGAFRMSLPVSDGEARILLHARDVHCQYVVGRTPWGAPRKILRAVDGVSLRVAAGETLAVVGESGCGKSTLGRTLIGLSPPVSGTVTFDGVDIYRQRHDRRAMRRRLQIIFQDPYASLNPRMTAGEIISEPLLLHRLVPKAAVVDRVVQIMQDVGLAPYHADRYPHQFSGGQRQRIGIARALACGPDVIVCDEPVSALDLSVRAQVVNLLVDLQQRYSFSYVFISHDLSLVRRISHRVAVMYLGRIVEQGDTGQVFQRPRHPYTRALLGAIPRPTPHRIPHDQILEGDLPSPTSIPPGCRFAPRCAYALPVCHTTLPQLSGNTDHHLAACHRQDELDLASGLQSASRPSPALLRRAAAFASQTEAGPMQETINKEEII